MAKIVTATEDFNVDFQRSFNEDVPSISTKTKNKYSIIDNQLIEDAKLIIFTGGEDINPAIYGHENKFSFVNRNRDVTELSILSHALMLNKKILGVCRGHQLINAYLGGMLIQDLHRELHKDHEHYHSLEPLTFKGVIPSLFKEVNSLHHQGVVKPGKSLVATSTYKGVIESCESKSILTVQFHPEFMANQDADDFFEFIKLWANIGD